MQNIPWVRSRTWILIIFTSQLQPQTAWIRSHALAILEQTHSSSPARFQDNLFDLQNRVHFLVIGSKYRQLILGVRYDLAKAVGLDVCLRTFFCLDKFVNHFPVWQEAMQCEVWMLASHEWLAGYTDYRELRYTVRIRSSISVHSATKTMYNYNISENHTSWLMYFVLRAPYSMHICTKGIGFHENRMIDVAAELRASWHRSCMHVLLPTSSSICIPILIHRKGSPSFLLASHFLPAQPIVS